ncbi:hypothetical protein FKM82_030673 [Ascaphus truei]
MRASLAQYPLPAQYPLRVPPAQHPRFCTASSVCTTSTAPPPRTASSACTTGTASPPLCVHHSSLCRCCTILDILYGGRVLET